MKTIDLILSLTIMVNIYGLFPQIWDHYRFKRVPIVNQMIITKTLSAISFTSCYIFLGIHKATVVAGIGLLCWLTIIIQKIMYRPGPIPECMKFPSDDHEIDINKVDFSLPYKRNNLNDDLPESWKKDVRESKNNTFKEAAKEYNKRIEEEDDLEIIEW